MLIRTLTLTAVAGLITIAAPAHAQTLASTPLQLTPQSKPDPAVRAFLEWMKKYNAAATLRDANNVYGYEVAQTLVEVLKKCGDDLTRANVMKQAASLDLQLGMLQPGIRITTSPTDYRPIKQLFLVRFDGRDWVALGKATGN